MSRKASQVFGIINGYIAVLAISIVSFQCHFPTNDVAHFVLTEPRHCLPTCTGRDSSATVYVPLSRFVLQLLSLVPNNKGPSENDSGYLDLQNIGLTVQWLSKLVSLPHTIIYSALNPYVPPLLESSSSNSQRLSFAC
ncbi:hypothetical protein J6590_075783 [Homalodisca vitripennis]|nr:hypothetical protein J6590_075783 [Homalodisca vitripennis]